jgi:hypothetical protein
MNRRITIVATQVISAAAVMFLARPIASACAFATATAPQLLAAEGYLERKIKNAKIDQIEGDLEKNPKLLDDPTYLAQHPKLADYLKKHPEAKPKIQQDPKTFFQHLKDEQG